MKLTVKELTLLQRAIHVTLHGINNYLEQHKLIITPERADAMNSRDDLIRLSEKIHKKQQAMKGN